MDNESCESCCYVLRKQMADPWTAGKYSDVFTCRRFPPQCFVYLNCNDDTDGHWAAPEVKRNDWCGEYVPRGEYTRTNNDNEDDRACRQTLGEEQ